MDGSPLSAGGGATPGSPTSPLSSRHSTVKRKRTMIGAESSPGSGHEDDIEDSGKKRQPGVKRACNECRQQKLRCDVIQEPFQSCSRCRRLNLDCKIESNFKRVGKRSKHAEMEREIDLLRRSIQRAKAQGFVFEEEDQLQSPIASSTYSHTRNPSLMGSDEAVSSLLHLKRGGSYNLPRVRYELDTVRLTDETVNQLFAEYFNFYHPFLPFLNPAQPPDQYQSQHPLLFWCIIAVAARRFRRNPTLLTSIAGPLTNLLWTTIGEVPTSYFVVKALCLLCNWPLPTSTTSADPTHILCGVMMKTATMIGLHRPTHSQDFSRVSVELNREQLHDRVMTWAVCNIVAQNIGTGYGQPASTLYDWTLATKSAADEGELSISAELEARLKIERFCDKVSKEMYSNASDPRGVAGDEHRAMLMRVYRRDFAELQAHVLSQQLSPCVSLHLRAANLHLRLAGFFDSSATPGYMDDLMGLWRATTAFLDELLEVEKVTSPPETSHGSFLMYATNYMQQMLVAAGFALLKLLRSFFAKTIDFERGRTLFHQTVQAIRATSVAHNDLQSRLAELMVQMWNGARMGAAPDPVYDGSDDSPIQIDDRLQLKVRCRHSMSLVFDSIWRWREEYQALGRGSLDSLKQPTNPDSANESSASSSHLDGTLIATSHDIHGNSAGNNNNSNNNNNNINNSNNGNVNGNILGGPNGTLPPGPASLSAPVSSAPSMMGGMGYGVGDTNYDFFDPQHWMLDGLVDFTYNFATPLEGV